MVSGYGGFGPFRVLWDNEEDCESMTISLVMET